MSKLIVSLDKIVIASTFYVCAFVLSACTVNPEATVYTASPVTQIQEPPIEPISESNNAFQRTRIIADILYEAKYAFDDNKLMMPTNDNAYDRYREVLTYDPENAVAIEGIKEIVTRYIELANLDIQNFQYDSAEGMLNRASSIDPGNEIVLSVRQRLAQARTIKRDRYELDEEQLDLQSIDMLVVLADIAEKVRRDEATFLITARDDAEGRWIYKVMREAVGGYRLRGNIILGSEPGVQINSPGNG